MAISASMVKELRETTGAGMLDCKKALEATDGNIESAIDWLREKGISKAAKKSTLHCFLPAPAARQTPIRKQLLRKAVRTIQFFQNEIDPAANAAECRSPRSRDNRYGWFEDLPTAIPTGSQNRWKTTNTEAHRKPGRGQRAASIPAVDSD